MKPGEQPYLDAVHAVLTLNRYLRSYAKSLNGQELTGRQLATLRYLAEAGPKSMGRLSEYLFINESSTSEHVTKLENTGFVVRTRSKSDNRIVEVDVTDIGRKVADATPLGGIPLLREKLKNLPASELVSITEAVSKLVRLLEIENG